MIFTDLPLLVLHTVCLFLDFNSLYQFVQVSDGCFNLGQQLLRNSLNLLSFKHRSYIQLRDIPIDERAKKTYYEIKNCKPSKFKNPSWMYFKMMNQYHRGIVFSQMGQIRSQTNANEPPTFIITFVLKVTTILPNMITLNRYFLDEHPISVNPIAENTIIKSYHTSNNLVLHFSRPNVTSNTEIGIIVDFKKFDVKIIESDNPFLLTSANLHWSVGSKARGSLIEISDSLNLIVSVFKHYTQKTFTITDSKFSKMFYSFKCTNSDRFVLIVDYHFQHSTIIDLKLKKILQHNDFKFLKFDQRFHFHIKFYCHQEGPDFNFYCIDGDSSLFDSSCVKVWKLDGDKTRMIFETKDNYNTNLLYCPVLKRLI